MEGVGSSGWNDNGLVPIAIRGCSEDTHICLKFGGAPFHQLHEVTRFWSEEYFMTIFEFRSKILAGEIVIQLYEYGHSLSDELIRGRKSFNG